MTSENEYDDDGFGLDDVDPAKCAPGGAFLPEGYYHLGITEVVRHADKNGNCVISCEVLMCADQKLRGRLHTEYLAWPDRSKGETYNRIKAETLLAWCLAAAIITEEDIARRKAEHKGFDPSWLDAMVGRDLIGKVEHEEYKDKNDNTKTSAKIEKKVWRTDSPKIAGVLSGGTLSSGQGTKKPKDEKKPDPPFEPNEPDPLGDLPV